MKKIFICFILFILTLAGCSKPPDEEDLLRLKKNISLFYSSIETDDHQTRISLFDDNAKMLPDNWTMIEGKEAIAETVLGDGNHLFRIKDRVLIEIELSGKLAYTVNSYFYAYYKKGEEPVWHKTKNIHIWKKDAENNWKLHLDIWNSDSPPGGN